MPARMYTHKALAAGAAALLAAATLSACGGSSKEASASSSPNEIGVGNESYKPKPEAPEPTTPKSGPLSKEPKVTVPKGAAPKKLVEKTLVKGNGKVAKKGDEVIVNYVGVLYKNGKVFDASWNRHETFSFTLGTGSVIKGWEEGVTGMHVGERRELIIPPELGYGKEGSGSTILPCRSRVRAG